MMYFNFGPVVQEILFEYIYISYLDTTLPTPFLAEKNHLCNFGRGHHEEHFSEIIFY